MTFIDFEIQGTCYLLKCLLLSPTWSHMESCVLSGESPMILFPAEPERKLIPFVDEDNYDDDDDVWGFHIHEWKCDPN